MEKDKKNVALVSVTLNAVNPMMRYNSGRILCPGGAGGNRQDFLGTGEIWL